MPRPATHPNRRSRDTASPSRSRRTRLRWCASSSSRTSDSRSDTNTWVAQRRRSVAPSSGLPRSCRSGGSAKVETDQLNAVRILEKKPSSAGATSSPRSSANFRRSSSSSGVTFLGVSTVTTTTRSPRPRPVELRDASTPEVELPSGLGALRDHQILVAVERGQLQVGPECALGHRDLDLVHEVVAVPVEAFVLADAELHEEVTRRSTARSRRPPAR